MKNRPLLLFIVLFLICFSILLFFINKYVPGIYINNDFFDYYIGSRLFWLHKDIYGPNPGFVSLVEQYELKFVWATGYSYPPFFAMLFYPFLFLSPFPASLLWIGCNIIFYGIFTYCISSQRKHHGKYILAFFMLTFMPSLYSISAGQINIFFLYIIYGYVNNKHYRGLFLALATILKVYPYLFFIKELIEKKWKTVLVGMFSLILFLLLPVLFDGWSNTYAYFLKVLPSLNNTAHTYYINQSINGVLSRLFALPTKNDHVFISPSFLTFINVFMSLIVIWFLCLLTYFKKNNKPLLLFWLGCLTLIAGKNSFWNFTPCILIGIFLLDNWSRLSKKQRIVFIFTVFITNFAWNGVSYFERVIPIEHMGGRLIYVTTSSLGFIALIIQLFLLKAFFVPR